MLVAVDATIVNTVIGSTILVLVTLVGLYTRYADRKRGHQLQQVHVLVNDRLTRALERIGTLEAEVRALTNDLQQKREL